MAKRVSGRAKTRHSQRKSTRKTRSTKTSSRRKIPKRFTVKRSRGSSTRTTRRARSKKRVTHSPLRQTVKHEAKQLMIVVVGLLFLFVVFQGYAGVTGFTAGKTYNTPPFWDSPQRTFLMSSTLTLDLYDYFKDREGDTLTFGISHDPNLIIQLEKSILTLQPREGFSKVTLTLYASDGIATTNQQIDIRR